MVKPTIRMPSLVPSIIRYTLLLLTTTITTQARCYNNPSFRIDNDPDKPCSWLRYGSNKDENRREAYSNIVHLPKSIKPVLNHVAHAARMIQPMNLKSKSKQMKNCEWLSKKMSRQQKWCGDSDRTPAQSGGRGFKTYQNGRMIRDACPVACDMCFDNVPIGPTTFKLASSLDVSTFNPHNVST